MFGSLARARARTTDLAASRARARTTGLAASRSRARLGAAGLAVRLLVRTRVAAGHCNCLLESSLQKLKFAKISIQDDTLIVSTYEL
jgi:hypothetical protein